jgi:hypothetical protein
LNIALQKRKNLKITEEREKEMEDDEKKVMKQKNLKHNKKIKS